MLTKFLKYHSVSMDSARLINLKFVFEYDFDLLSLEHNNTLTGQNNHIAVTRDKIISKIHR